ncbi:EXT1C protein, partial [Polyodon spathula]|nr:EXT1C protein [Polyodon spathula]
MQARKKYILLAFCASWLLVFYFGGAQIRLLNYVSRRKNEEVRPWPLWVDRHALQGYAPLHELQNDGAPQQGSPKSKSETRTNIYKNSRCRMETCFDFSKCEKFGFKVYVYPLEKGDRVSESYQKIITSIVESRYYTPNPQEACLFVLNIDTLDRDQLSVQYVHNVNERIRGFPLWNDGRNHLIFNLYSGTWPNYTEDLGLDLGQAILAKASFYVEHFRPGFDISIPLFSKEHPQKGGERGWLVYNNVPPRRKYLLVFKGKRYLTGIGQVQERSDEEAGWERHVIGGSHVAHPCDFLIKMAGVALQYYKGRSLSGWYQCTANTVIQLLIVLLIRTVSLVILLEIISNLPVLLARRVATLELQCQRTTQLWASCQSTGVVVCDSLRSEAVLVLSQQWGVGIEAVNKNTNKGITASDRVANLQWQREKGRELRTAETPAFKSV